MYWLVRSGALTIDPVFKYDEAVSLTGSAMSGDIVDVISTGDVTTWSLVTGDVVSGSIADAVSGDEVDLNTTVALMTGSGDGVLPVDGATTTTSSSTLSRSKETACQWSEGNFDNPLQVTWNAAATATTRGYAKLRNFLHYVVFVSDGTKYYFYHNCDTGVATNAQNVTSTVTTKIVSLQGQVYLR